MKRQAPYSSSFLAISHFTTKWPTSKVRQLNAASHRQADGAIVSLCIIQVNLVITVRVGHQWNHSYILTATDCARSAWQRITALWEDGTVLRGKSLINFWTSHTPPDTAAITSTPMLDLIFFFNKIVPFYLPTSTYPLYKQGWKHKTLILVFFITT